jgi:hypothetical protein
MLCRLKDFRRIAARYDLRRVQSRKTVLSNDCVRLPAESERIQEAAQAWKWIKEMARP